jgi:hypothetical protein
MAKRLSTEEKLTHLADLATRPISDESMKELKKALAAANNLVVAKAAKVAAECHLDVLAQPLADAFTRFIGKPAKADQRCFAKVALVEALDTLDYRDYEVFLKGVHHVQMEPVYGGQEDTAAGLRAKSAIALAKHEYPDVFFELVPLLTDAEPQPRIAAIKALTYLNEDKSELLLRLKVLTGDDEPQVLSECFAGLMSIAPQRSMPFVANYLTASDLLIVEGAALALGESRDPQAFALLRDLWEDTLDQELKKLLLLPMALSRCDDAFDFLLDVVACEYRDYAAAAVKALRVYADSQEQCEKIQHVVVARHDRSVTEAYENEFGCL